MTKTWAEIRQTYSNFNNASADLMIALVVEIESSRYADCLFAWNSHADLCIVPNPVEYPYDGPFLQLTPLASGELEFRYVDASDDTTQLHLAASPDRAFEQLVSVIEQLHWFASS